MIPIQHSLMSESAIFKNKSKLSPRYLPEELPHRQAQIQQIVHVFSDAPGDPDHFPLTVLQVIGAAGIGKTSTVLRSSKILEEVFEKRRLTFKSVYINMKLQGGNKFAIYETKRSVCFDHHRRNRLLGKD